MSDVSRMYLARVNVGVLTRPHCANKLPLCNASINNFNHNITLTITKKYSPVNLNINLEVSC